MEAEINERIFKLTKEFKGKIPSEDEDYEILINEFKRYLEDTVQIIKNSDDKFTSKNPETIKLILERTAKRFFMYDIKSIKQTLLKDDAFDSLVTKSLKIFEIAKMKTEKKAIKVEYNVNNEIDEMKKMLESVKDYNQDSAKKILSEAFVDLKFIEEENSDIMSLRMGHFLREKAEEER